MKIRLLMLLLAAVSSAGCQSSAHKSQLDTLDVQVSPPIVPPGKVVLQFYQWFLKDIYPESNQHLETPSIEPTADSVYQINADQQFAALKKTGYFADSFYKTQQPVYNTCNVQLQKVQLAEVRKCGCSPTEFVNTNDCDFLTYHAWTGGQGEDLSAVKIIQVKTSGNTSGVIAELGDGKYAYSHPAVDLVKEGNSWKISKITVSYDVEKK